MRYTFIRLIAHTLVSKSASILWQLELDQALITSVDWLKKQELIGDMIIAVDFDGVINASPYPNVGVLVGGAKDAMQELKRRGHHLVIWTCREGQDQTDAINFLLEKGIPFDGINCNARENFERYSNDCRKVYADIYIDDRNLGGFPGWKEALRLIDEGTNEEKCNPYEGCFGY